ARASRKLKMGQTAEALVLLMPSLWLRRRCRVLDNWNISGGQLHRGASGEFGEVTVEVGLVVVPRIDGNLCDRQGRRSLQQHPARPVEADQPRRPLRTETELLGEALTEVLAAVADFFGQVGDGDPAVGADQDPPGLGQFGCHGPVAKEASEDLVAGGEP